MQILRNTIQRLPPTVWAVCGELGQRTPAGSVVTHVYVSLGELPAVLVAASLLLDLVLLPALAARGGSEYVAAAANFSVRDALGGLALPRPLRDSDYLAPQPDLLAAALALVATMTAVLGTKVACRAGVVGVAASLAALVTAAVTALVGADPRHWTGVQGFLPRGLHGVVSGAAVLSIGMGGAHLAGLMAGECNRYQCSAQRVGVVVGVLAFLVLLPTALSATLASPALAPSATFIHLFPGASLIGVKVLVGVGSVAGLWAGMVGALLAGSRLAYGLGRDGLAPAMLERISPFTATPWTAILCCGGGATLAAMLCSSWLLRHAAGAGGLSAGVAGAAALLARRFRPEAPRRPPEAPTWTPSAVPSSHSCHNFDELTEAPPAVLDEDAPRQVAVEWRSGSWSSTLEPPIPPTWLSWRTSRFLMVTFMVDCVVGAGVVRGAKELGLGVWAWAGVVLCVGGCVVCGVGLWLQPRNPSPRRDQRDTTPFLPLLALLANLLLLLHLPGPALAAAGGVWATAAATWLVKGRTSSTEAVLRRALLTHSGHACAADLL
ncbi:Cationic amino acid transporter 4 [Portunus trituberculatus]|uniref:Cationic amino acid transporter 4 n=1 Tax=Portunus trituberculatus TaxID=210409 RepID=A0A5B7FS50_PORTR|nr:Cationic amino acid transporter 4 [Portunus trituberculatus]